MDGSSGGQAKRSLQVMPQGDRDSHKQISNLKPATPITASQIVEGWKEYGPMGLILSLMAMRADREKGNLIQRIFDSIIQKVSPYVTTFCKKQPYFLSIVAAIATLGYAATLLLKKWKDILTWLMSYAMSHASFMKVDDKLYHNVMRFIVDHAVFKFERSVLARSALYLKNTTRSDAYNRKGVVYHGTSNLQLFKFQGRCFVLTNQPDEKEFKIWTLGRTPKKIKDLVNQIDAEANADDYDYVDVYRASIPNNDYYHSEWKTATKFHKRPLDSMFLEPQQRKVLLDDLTKFLSPDRRKVYSQNSIPYRRGYLFYGPPGCGKLSFANAVASHWGLSIYTLSLLTEGLTDEKLQKLMALLGPGCLLLLEDVDSLGLGREFTKADSKDESENVAATASQLSNASKKSRKKKKANKEQKSMITLSALLNVLDGAHAPEGHIVILTTNHLEALDSALTREGRFSLTVEFALACREQARDMFYSMYSDVTSTIEFEASADVSSTSPDCQTLSDLADTFAAAIPEGTFSVVSIQEYILTHNDPQRAVDGVGASVRKQEEVKENKRKAKEETEATLTNTEGLSDASTIDGDTSRSSTPAKNRRRYGHNRGRGSGGGRGRGSARGRGVSHQV